MNYLSWFEQHSKKHKKIVDKLLKMNYDTEQIIKYFDFENMKKKEIDFCPLYCENKKCHNMEELNCYLCACPNFRFNDEGIEKTNDKTKFSYCSISSKDGKLAEYGDSLHQDCSICTVPHIEQYIKDNFSLDWNTVMQKCVIKN